MGAKGWENAAELGAVRAAKPPVLPLPCLFETTASKDDEKPPLPGPRKKQAEALTQNILWMSETFGKERIGFLTLTLGDFVAGGRFRNLRDRKEAQRRFHSLMTNEISKRYVCGVSVTERHKNGGIHFHLVVVCKEDIYGQIDFAACFPPKDCLGKPLYEPFYLTANDAIKREWAYWLRTAKLYGFGRHQVQPMRTNGEALGRYLGAYLADVTAKSFELWRQKKAGELSIKTRNEYRASMFSMLAWLEENEELAANPFKRVKKTDGRGLETLKRRAATQSEMDGLLSVAGDFAVAYLAAVTTGLRRGELSQLELGDFHLDVAQPVAMVRTATTKDREPAKVYLGRQLVAELRKLHSPGMPTNSLALADRMPTMDKMREHLAAAGIPFKDDQGRRLDFHALRGTYDTNLAIAGVSDAVRMKLMRHKSPRLTLETYTDSEKVPVAASLAKMPEFGFGKNGKEHTGKDTGILVQGGQSVSSAVTIGNGLNCDKTPVNIGESHGLSPLVLFGHKESNGGERGIRTPGAF
jgi:integrase